jgi:RluA family pseudouridine synthase
MEDRSSNHTVGEAEHRLRLDRYIRVVRPDLSRNAIARLLATGIVHINDVPRDARFFVKRGDHVAIRLSSPTLEYVPRILLRTQHMIAVAKPPGLPTNPVAGNRPSLLSWVGKQTAPQVPGIVHRLDRATSGIVLFSLSPEGHEGLDQGFRDGMIRKGYLALVTGRIHPKRGSISRPLERTASGKVRVDPKGRHARTDYMALSSTPLCSLIEARPHTGRMHQIRVHLASIGHPVASDPLYGDPRHALGSPRLWLHAAWIELPEALTASLSATPRIECPLWEDLVTHLERLGLKLSPPNTQDIGVFRLPGN